MEFDAKELTDGLKRGDRKAQAALYTAYSGKMLKTLRRVVGNDDAAQDLLHDGFIVVFTHIGSLRRPDRLEAWVSRIMTNLALQYLQGRGGMLPADGLEDVLLDDSGTDAADSLRFDDIMAMIGRLPEGYRNVFRLSVLEGLSHDEIARKLGIGPRSSSSQLLRARRKLQEMVREHIARMGLLAVLLAALLAVLLFNGGDDRVVSLAPKTAVRVDTAARRRLETRQTAGAQVPARQGETIALPQGNAVDTCLRAQNMFADTMDVVPVDSILTAMTAVDSIWSMAVRPVPDSLFTAYVPTETKSKWLLGMASTAEQASSSLLPRVLSVVSGAAEGGTRVDIETWQQLTHYLTYDVGDNLDPAEREALLRIAMANEGRIYTRRSYEKPLQVGVNLSKRLSDRWALDFGLRLTRHTTRLQTGESDTTNISERQRTMFIGVPVNATYSLWNKGRWTLYGTAGAALDIPFYGRSKTDYNLDNAVIYHREERLRLPRWQWSVNVGMGVGYEIAPNLQLYVSPKLTWYIPNGSQTVTQWQDKPWQLSVPFGLRVVFK